MLNVQRGEQTGDLVAQLRLHRGRLRTCERHGGAHEAGGGGDLGTEHPVADDHDPVGLQQFPAKPCGVVEGPQHMDACRTRQTWESARVQSGGQHDGLRCQLRPTLRVHGARGGVEGQRAIAEDELRVQ